MKCLKTALIILFSWGIATITHEFGHIIIARCFGFVATIESIGFNAASVIVHGVMTPFELSVIASAGSIILILSGIVLILFGFRITGLVFVSRSWVDMVPMGAKDGSIIADSSGIGVAVVLLLIELVAVGLVWYFVFRSTKPNFFYGRFFRFDVSTGIVFYFFQPDLTIVT